MIESTPATPADQSNPVVAAGRSSALVGSTPLRLTLRELSLPVRLVLALFMISVGVGYVSALVNLHFQEASPGSGMPTPNDVVASYHGQSKQSHFVRLLETQDAAPFNGQGSMRSAFTKRAPGLSKKVKEKVNELKETRNLTLDLKKPAEAKIVRDEVMKDLDGERISLILWSLYDPDQTKRDESFKKMQETYDNDEYVLPEEHKNLQISQEFIKDLDGGKRAVMVRSIMEKRCVRCHSENVGGAGANYPLDSWGYLSSYLREEAPTGRSLEKLALSTHVHLLGFSMLYGLTGLVFAFSSYPGVIRFFLAPLPLLAQLVDISFWWLSRMDAPLGPQFAQAIILTGGIVGGSLFLQIVFCLFNLFGKAGKALLVLLLAGALFGAYQLKILVVDKHLETERGSISTKL